MPPGREVDAGDLPDDSPLCLLTLNGQFDHSILPFIRELPGNTPDVDRLLLTSHGITGNFLSEAFVLQKKSAEKAIAAGRISKSGLLASDVFALRSSWLVR